VFLSYSHSHEDKIYIELDDGRTYAELAWDNVEGDIALLDTSPRNETASPEELLRHESEWMDFFRRGLWLSGADIEATAHEKAEWLQGFTREEIEAWNLKM
jgi:hypothetical protein